MSAGWEAVIGLEVHVQLATKTKLFCGCSTRYGAAPNTNVCPVCLGHPGVLPVLNHEAVALGLALALALGCSIRPRSRFARKNYFYPDLPKGYQISQYDEPFASHGSLDIDGEAGAAPKRVGITRIHFEEDAGKLLHDAGPDGASLVDFNRAGVALCECVSEPDLRSPAEAYEYLTELRAVVRASGASPANMEEGSLRCDANVSLRRPGERFGTRAELKNMNSFRNVEKGLAFEIERQAKILEAGGVVVQETRLFDAARGETFPMRSKEEAHDYRYFPEPDLLPLAIAGDWIAGVRSALPELPRARRERFVRDLELKPADARVLTLDTALADYLEACVRAGAAAREAANWILRDLLRWTKETGREPGEFPVAPVALAELLALVADGSISSAQAKALLDEMVATGKGARALVSEHGLAQVSDAGAIAAVVTRVVAGFPAEATRYRSGKTGILGFFVGQVMKEMGGQANPKTVSDLVVKELSGS